ncbi:MAG TPA: hypothetical protein VGL53_03895 [Bryobacteraceae bacterium]
MRASLVAWLLVTSAWAQNPLHDDTKLGLPAGAVAPDFSLPDQSGHTRTLASLEGPQGLVLVFFRSADW